MKLVKISCTFIKRMKVINNKLGVISHIKLKTYSKIHGKEQPLVSWWDTIARTSKFKVVIHIIKNKKKYQKSQQLIQIYP